ncbi:hypothetical protein Ct61P_14529 [Colletotrichum tofieldiae]|nr:hypothetical protein Ct61P_14529 [Colletotrichum tofieldiae]
MPLTFLQVAQPELSQAMNCFLPNSDDTAVVVPRVKRRMVAVLQQLVNAGAVTSYSDQDGVWHAGLPIPTTN